MKVVMLGADRSVKGGVSAVVNNLYEAGLDQRIDLTYIGTMVDGSTAAKLLKGVQALLKFVTVLPKADIVHLNMAGELLPEADFYADRPLVPQKSCNSRARRRFSGLLL